MILSETAPDKSDFDKKSFLSVYEAATELYSLIHARYILSPQGLEDAREMFLMARFGTWPRVLWKRQAVIPVGMSTEYNASRVKIYWPLWKDLYSPKRLSKDVDGCAYGPGFPQALMLAYPDLALDEGPSQYVPKLYGFKIFGLKGSKYEIEYNKDGDEVNRDEITKVRHLVLWTHCV